MPEKDRVQEVDSLIAGVLADAPGRAGTEKGWTLMAVGGYGRRQLAPYSDIDLALIHSGLDEARIKSLVQQMFYPLWDAKLQVSHLVKTSADAVTTGSDDLHWLTSSLDARFLGGDPELFNRTAKNMLALAAARKGRPFLTKLMALTHERWKSFGHSGRQREPELKDGHGGLRDIQVIRWMLKVIGSCLGIEHESETAKELGLLGPEDLERLAKSEEFLLKLRAQLHELSGRGLDKLTMEYQAPVAGALFADVDDAPSRLGIEVFESTRQVAFLISVFFNRLDERLSQWNPWSDRTIKPVSEAELESGGGLTIEELLSVLRSGQAGLPTLERFSYEGRLESLVPEWRGIRGRTFIDADHAHPVDTHSFFTVAELVKMCEKSPTSDLASAAYIEITHTDWLLLAGLLHDIGKGRGDAHAIAGAQIAAEAAERLGLERQAQETISFLVRHHLLLSHTAIRRDLDDDRTIDGLATVIGDGDRLKMLYLLTIADALATGPNVWNAWKSALVAEVFLKTLKVLEGGAGGNGRVQVGLEEKHFNLLNADREIEAIFLEAEPGFGELAVVAPDRPGLFSRIAGILALNGLSVLAARVYTADGRRALEVFRVAPAFEPVITEEMQKRVCDDIGKALSGQMALSYHMDQLDRRYKKSGKLSKPSRIEINNSASDEHTIVEVYAEDEIGLLYKITSALHELNLDIHFAKISTFGSGAIDIFYISDLRGRKITASEHLGEIERNILFRLSRPS